MHREEFTHMVLMSTDLIVNQININKMLRNIEKFRLKIYSGVCNLEREDNRLNCSISEVDPNKMNFRDWIERDWATGLRQDVGYCGLALLCIDRETAKVVPLIFDESGHNFDVYFNRSIREMGEKITVDFDNFCYHKRYAREVPDWTDPRIIRCL